MPCGRLRVSTTNRVIERKKRNLSARHYTQWRNENSPEAFGVCVPETRTMRVYPPLCIPPATWKFLTATEGGAPRVLCPRGRGGFVFFFSRYPLLFLHRLAGRELYLRRAHERLLLPSLLKCARLLTCDSFVTWGRIRAATVARGISVEARGAFESQSTLRNEDSSCVFVE